MYLYAGIVKFSCLLSVKYENISIWKAVFRCCSSCQGLTGWERECAETTCFTMTIPMTLIHPSPSRYMHYYSTTLRHLACHNYIPCMLRNFDWGTCFPLYNCSMSCEIFLLLTENEAPETDQRPLQTALCPQVYVPTTQRPLWLLSWFPRQRAPPIRLPRQRQSSEYVNRVSRWSER